MKQIINFLKKRRSVVIKNLLPDPIPSSDLKEILECGIRIPDHAILSPWRIKVIQGHSRQILGKNILAGEYLKLYPEANEKMIEFEKNRFMRAGVVLSIISKSVPHPKIPVWEMHLSCGALCQNILNASIALGYGAQWVTEWYSNNERLLTYLGGNKDTDKFAGFIYIGKSSEKPTERKRANVNDVVEFLDLK